MLCCIVSYHITYYCIYYIVSYHIAAYMYYYSVYVCVCIYIYIYIYTHTSAYIHDNVMLIPWPRCFDVRCQDESKVIIGGNFRHHSHSGSRYTLGWHVQAFLHGLNPCYQYFTFHAYSASDEPLPCFTHTLCCKVCLSSVWCQSKLTCRPSFTVRHWTHIWV